MKFSGLLGVWFGSSKRAGLAALLLTIGLGVPVFAQSVAEISGTVQDKTGAAVSGAVVKITQVQTSFTRSVLTEGNGAYTAVNLPIGPYVIEVAQPGFSPYKQTGIVLEVNTNPKINIVLAVGNVATEVNVEASTVSVETVSNAVGTVMENQSIVDLPLNGRQVTDLMLLQPGAVLNGSPLNRGFPVSPIAIGGGGVANNLYLLDG